MPRFVRKHTEAIKPIAKTCFRNSKIFGHYTESEAVFFGKLVISVNDNRIAFRKGEHRPSYKVRSEQKSGRYHICLPFPEVIFRDQSLSSVEPVFCIPARHVFLTIDQVVTTFVSDSKIPFPGSFLVLKTAV